jgi:hypothetical protein
MRGRQWNIAHVRAEMNALHGIVSSHAQTMRPATPQRTADALDDGADADDRARDRMRRRHRDAEVRREKERYRASRFGAEAADGFELRDAESHRPDDAPAARQRTQAHGGVAREHDPQRHVERLAEQAVRVEQHGDDAHRLLRVVAAVAQAVESRRDELAAAEPRVDARGVYRRKIQKTATINQKPSASPTSGESTIETPIFVRQGRRGPSRRTSRPRRRRGRRSARATSSTECRTTR